MLQTVLKVHAPVTASATAKILPRWLLWIAAIAIAAGLAFVALRSIFADRPQPVAAAPVLPPAVSGLGYFEPSSGIVKVSASGSPDGAKIGTLLVNEGDRVSKGQVLAVVDTEPKLKAQLAQAQAAVALRRLHLERQRLDTRQSRTTRGAGVASAQAAANAAQAEYDRKLNLFRKGYATKATLDAAQQSLSAARAALVEAQAASARANGGTRGAQIDLAIAEQEVASAEADARVAQANLDQAYLRAPFDGRVLTIVARPGEKAGNDGVLELAATQDMRAVVEVYETDIGRIRIGQKVTLISDSLVSDVTGTVQRIGATVERQTTINNTPAATTDARVIKVFVVLDPAAQATVEGLSYLQLRGEFAR